MGFVKLAMSQSLVILIGVIVRDMIMGEPSLSRPFHHFYSDAVMIWTGGLVMLLVEGFIRERNEDD